MSTGVTSASVHPLRREALMLLQAAMVVFTWTVVIGILNGTDLTDFGRKAVLSHVHAGTLGWITMCVFAAALWLFGVSASPAQVRTARILTVAAVITLPALALTFAVTFGNARTIMGSFALATIVGYFVWVLLRLRNMELSATHLGFLAAIATSVTGGAIGVLLAAKIATGRDVIPSGGADAHPGTMVVGFLIPVGMALAEWGLGWPTLKRTGRLGTLQIALPFIGGLLLMISLLFDLEPLIMIAAFMEFGGVIIYIVRNLPVARRVSWRTGSPARFAVASSIAIVVNILFINYLAGRYAGDFDRVPARQMLALDHTMFIGVMTNAIFGLLLGTTQKDHEGRWADQAIFFGMNLGLVGFVVSLMGDVVWLERIATLLIGSSILLGLSVYTLRFRSVTVTDAMMVERVVGKAETMPSELAGAVAQASKDG